MKLNSITLENYRKFKNTFIEFPDGVVGIIGLNGVGKSTIIEAIAWVMYGNQSAIVRTKKESIKREGSPTSQPCRVTLEFELDGNQYKLIREMKGTTFSTNAQAYVNKKLEATNAKQVTEFVEKTLCMDYQSFFTSVFARQNELDSFSGLEPHKRKKLILRMLNIDSVEKAVEKIKEDKKFKKSWIDGVRTNLYDEKGNLKIENLKIENENLKEKKEKISETIQKLKVNLKNLKSEVETLKKKKETEEKKYKKNNELNNNLRLQIQNKKNSENRKLELETEIKKLREKSKRLEEIKEKDKEFEKNKIKKENLEEQRAKQKEKLRLEKEISQLKIDLRKRDLQIKENEKLLKNYVNVENDLKEILKKKDENNNKMMKIISEIQRTKTEIENEKKGKREIEKKRKEITKLGKDSLCPTCERPLDEQYENLISKFENEINLKNTVIEKLEKEWNNKKNEKTEFEKRGDAISKREDYLRKMSKEKSLKESLLSQLISEFEERKKIIKEKEVMKKEIGEVIFDEIKYMEIKKELVTLSKIHDEIVGLKRDVTRIEKIKNNLEVLKEKLQEIEKNIKNLKDKIKTLRFDEKEYKEILLKYENKREDFVSKNNELIKEKTILTSLSEEIKKIKEQIMEMKKLSEKVKNEELELQYLDKLVLVLGDFKTYLISKIRPSLSTYATDLFSRLTDGKYNEMELDENYEIFIRENGNSYPIDRFSGGEVDLANLCLRLAISRVIAERSGGLELNFIILDEIFGSQDIYRKRNIISALNELSKQFRQIFLITHIEDVKEYMGYVLNVLEGEDGVSEVRVVG